MDALRISTGSWKYPSWKGLVYSGDVKNYLEEYARKYSTVEIDQWFWSLFPGGKTRLPNPKDVQEYRNSVTESFRFTIKVPNSLTLTHYYSRGERKLGPENPLFLSKELFAEFLDTIRPMETVLGPLILQFEYLNRQKMESQRVFELKMNAFKKKLPAEFQYAVEIRNGNYLNGRFLDFLWEGGWIPVFLQGYWMPSILELFRNFEKKIRRFSVIILRLHGENREVIEEETGRKWDRLVQPRDQELIEIARIVSDFRKQKSEIYINLNNHYEGSAPLTIEKFLNILSA
jgi:uncharacterized protein YecE (DUF72 family)